MTNPFPIKITDESGVVRLAGEADFTDPGNQPGGAGPRASLLVPWLAGIPSSPFGNNSGGAVLGDYDGGLGTVVNALTVPSIIVGAGGTVVDMAQITALLKCTGLTGAGLTDLVVQALVSNAAGTERALWLQQLQGTPSGASFNLALPGTGSNWSVLTGTDLVPTTTVLASTAGGVFTIAGVGLVVLD